MSARGCGYVLAACLTACGGTVGLYAEPADEAPSEMASEQPAPEAPPVSAAGLATEGEALRLSELFLERLVAADHEAAFGLIRPHFPVSDQQFARLAEETTQQMGMAELQFGPSRGVQFLRADEVQDRLLRIRFLQQFERDAMYWDFVYYRPDSGWVLNGLGFDDNIAALFP